MQTNSDQPVTLSAAREYRANRLAVNTVWLAHLRWAAVAGQLITIAVVHFAFRIQLPLPPLLFCVTVTATTNLAYDLWIRRRVSRSQLSALVRRRHILMGVLMAADLFSLTLLLYLTGGMENPFSIFYFVNLALSAIILPPIWAWGLTGVAILCMLVLTGASRPLPDLTPSLREGIEDSGDVFSQFQIGQLGQLVAFLACGIVLIHFVTRVSRELQEREIELRRIERLRSRSDKLEALGTLAAGAGHELATPLSTIAVVANEITHHLQGVELPPTVLDDVGLIRSEVEHCRVILDRMKGDVGQAIGDRVVSMSVAEIIEIVLAEVRGRERVTVSIDESASTLRILAPTQSLAQAIRGVVQNGIDASPKPALVELSADRIGGAAEAIQLKVRDHGPGMPPDVLARAGEPFFTTKEPGKGMGLGIFLTRSVIERLGGRFELESSANRGVTATIELPCHLPE